MSRPFTKDCNLFRDLRLQNGFKTQRSFAGYLGISADYVKKLENSERAISSRLTWQINFLRANGHLH